MGAVALSGRAPLRGRAFPAVPLAAAALLLTGVAGLVVASPSLAGHWPTLAGWLVTGVAAAVAGARWAEARQATRVRRDFALGMSHDLRTPLAQIQMFTEMLLLRRDRSETEREEWLHVIEREAHGLGGLIDNLLVLAHGPDPAAFPARETLDLGTLIEDVAATYAGRAAARGMRLVADPPPGVLVRADPRALRQTVANLIDNAVRFGPDGQSVVLCVGTGPDCAEISIEDQGPGLPPEERARLLGSPSFRPAPVRSGGGRGLGLAVVAQVVRAHGGRASVEDAPGGGSRIRIVLPLAAPAPESPCCA